ncbi:hypothetical protein [Maridesulfovibrio sp.]|uniref:hypothetical protein n=1 Tax=Maridesulfovibrio sp. TaxID=2795000 RepID=UPI0039EE0B98
MTTFNFAIKCTEEVSFAPFVKDLALSLQHAGYACLIHDKTDLNKEDTEIDVAIYPGDSDKLSPKPWHFNTLLQGNGNDARRYDFVQTRITCVRH